MLKSSCSRFDTHSFSIRSFKGKRKNLIFSLSFVFSLIDVIQPCITLDKKNTKEWYSKKIYKLDKNWPSKDKNKALIKVQEWGDKIPIGIFFRRNI